MGMTNIHEMMRIPAGITGELGSSGSAMEKARLSYGNAGGEMVAFREMVC